MPTSFTELPNYLRVQLDPQTRASEMMGAYQEAAVRCVEKGLMRALIVAADHDPQVHEELKSTLRTMALAGCATGFKFALVARHPDTSATYETAARIGQELGLDVQAFQEEKDAVGWLLGAPP